MRQLKRMESASKSPIFSHFSETLTGVTTIRAYNAQNRFIKIMQNHVDENLLYYFPNNISNRWLALRLELVIKKKLNNLENKIYFQFLDWKFDNSLCIIFCCIGSILYQSRHSWSFHNIFIECVPNAQLASANER